MRTVTNTTNTKLAVSVMILALATVTLIGCKSTLSYTEEPGVEQLGEYVVRQKGPEVDVVLGYRHAAAKLGEEWLLLEVAISSPNKRHATIERADIWVRTPAGKRIPLATQEEFGKVFSDMRARIREANIARDPMDYFPASRRPCQLEFFAAPGAAVTFDQVTVNDRRACEGKLFFRIPGSIQSGRWVLGIDLVESKVRIPFKL
jgi:hypothetical protein